MHASYSDVIRTNKRDILAFCFRSVIGDMSNQQNISSVLYLVCGEQAIFSNAGHFGLVMHNQEFDWLVVGVECHKT